MKFVKLLLSVRSLLILPVVGAALALSSCATEYGPNGQPRQVMTPMGAALIQTVSAAGIGAGTGALMNKAPGWANGMVSGGVSSIGSQVINSFIPQSGGGFNGAAQRPYYPPQPQQNYYAQDRAYAQPNQQPLYYQRPDGSFARAN